MKGRGAYVKGRKTLNKNEMKCLELLMQCSHLPLKNQDIVLTLEWSDRKVANALSNLHGMDLIKASDYKVTLTEEEEGIKFTGKAPHYWIGKPGEPIYKRAQYVLENNGTLQNIFLRELDFDLNLFPFRLLRKVTFLAPILNYSADTLVIDCSSLRLTSEELADIELLSHQKKVKVTLESS